MIYGYYNKIIKRIPIDVVCEDCGATELQYLDIVCRVNHVLFIPFYPSKKKVLRKCDVCGAIYKLDKNKDVEAILKEIKYPKCLYIGLIFFIFFLLSFAALFAFGYEENKSIKNNMINNVERGYTIIEKEDDGYKTTMLITDVRGDSVFVRKNMESTKGDVYEINEFEYYDSEIVIYTKDRLLKMINAGKIIDIVPTTLLFDMINVDLETDSIE